MAAGRRAPRLDTTGLLDVSGQAERLRALHLGPPILVLPNVWDVASALVVASVPGCRALATTSSGVAAALGFVDGERIPAEEMLAAVARIARAVPLPVSADLEAGYGSPAATARAAVEAGLAGLNLEDGAGPPEEHVERIRAVRAEVGDALVVNARVDVFLTGTGGVEEAAERANLYLRAGADCAFVIGVAAGPTIAELARLVEGPLNILATEETPPAAELERMGVARVSFGSGPMRVAAAATERVARELLEGRFDGLAGAFPSSTLRDLLESRL